LTFRPGSSAEQGEAELSQAIIPAFLRGGGEAEARLRDADWSFTSIGSPERWPQSLKTTLRLALASGYPMSIWWGRELIPFYNSAYLDAFPSGLAAAKAGIGIAEYFPENWLPLTLAIEATMGGEPVAGREEPSIMIRRSGPGGTEDWTCALAPIDDEAAPLGIGGVLVTFRNVTDEHRSARFGETEHEDERRRRLIVESAVDFAIIATDRNGAIIDWNSGAEHIFGWSADEMRGVPADRFFTSEDRAEGRVAIEMHTALETGRASDERWHVKKDGSRFWANGLMMPLRREDGAHLGFVKILRDQTDQRRVAEAHRADAELLRGVLHSSDDCIKMLDRAGGILLVNAAGRRVLKAEEGETFAGRCWLEFVRSEYHADAVAAFDAAKAGQTGHFQGAGATAVGESSWWDVQITPILDAEGRPDKFLSVSRDITAFKRAAGYRAAELDLGDRLRDLHDPAQMELAAAETIGRTLEVAGAGYGTVSTAWETVTIERDWAAAGVRSIAGLYRFRDYGSYIDELKRGETVAFSDAADDRRMTGSGDPMMAIGIRSGVNLPIFEQGSLAAIFFLRDRGVRVWSPEELHFVRNVADRTRAAVAGELARQQLHNLTGSLEREVEARTRERDRIWQVNRDLLGVADPDGVWVSINPAWKATLGWNEADIVGRTIDWLVHPDDLVSHPLSQLTRFENRLRTAGGTYRWLSWTAVAVDNAIYCVARDITADREQADALAQTEAQLRQAQKMEAVGQLTGGLAHDFNNLLAGISGSLELMRIRLEQGRIPDLERYIVAAQGASTRAASLTHRLLAFSRRQTLDPKPTDLNKLVAGMEELIRRTVGPAITMEAIAADRLWSIFVDPHQLENALLNLCINARDALPDGGLLRIETENQVLGDRAAREQGMAAGDYVLLSVSDDGVGMTQDVKARAFDPFFTTKPIGMGTGLGLSMIYGFVEQSGGQASIRSEVGEGTTVCLMLPRHSGEDQGAVLLSAAAAISRAHQGEAVLVVDDEPTVRMMVVEVLEDLGYRAIEAASGQGGLKILRSDVRIDLLITDVGLPGGMNGRQLADAGCLLRPDLKVLFITGYAESILVSPGRLNPGMEVLIKPFAIETLGSRIRELIGDG
jgi:PAS domain S-box-containing protein